MGQSGSYNKISMSSCLCVLLLTPSPSHHFVYNQRNRPISRHVAGGSEAVHGDVERNHQRLCRFIEAQHGLQDAQRCHDGASRHARGSHHRDAQHEDEAGKQGEVVGHALHNHQGKCARHNLQRAARQVDGGAKRDDEAGNVVGNTVLPGLFQRHGDGGGTRLRAESGEVGRHHTPQELEGILADKQCRDAVLEQQQEDVQQEDDADNLDEDHQDAEHLSAVRHVEEDAEDVDGKQWQYHGADGEDDNLPEVAGGILQHFTLQLRHAQPQHEGKHEGGHHVHQRRDADREIGQDALRLADLFQRHPGLYEGGKQRCSGEVGEESGKQGGTVGNECRDEQHPPGSLADVGNGYRDQPHDDEGDGEIQEFAEDGIEGYEQPYQRSRQDISEKDAKKDGDDDAWQQADVELLHERCFSVFDWRNRLSQTKILFYFRNSCEQMLIACCLHRRKIKIAGI